MARKKHNPDWQYTEKELGDELVDEYVDKLYEEIEHEIKTRNRPSVFKWIFVFALGWWFGGF